MDRATSSSTQAVSHWKDDSETVKCTMSWCHKAINDQKLISGVKAEASIYLQVWLQNNKEISIDGRADTNEE